MVEGNLELDADKIDAPIGAHPHIRERYAVNGRSGRESVTIYEVKERLKGYTFVALRPHTGRTHQLRVHMASLRHPIVADTMYGGKQPTVGQLLGTEDETPAIGRFALHARRIEFRHPITAKEMMVEAPLPADFEKLLELLRGR